MTPSDTLRAAIAADPRSYYQVAKQSGVAIDTLLRFADGGGITLATAEKLMRLYGFEIRPATSAARLLQPPADAGDAAE